MTRILSRLGVALALLALLIVIGLAAVGDVSEGEAVFMKRCKMCHGADGQGNPAMARMLKVEFKALDSEHVQELSDLELTETITEGKGKMAAVRGISDAEIEDVIAYVRSLDSDD